MIYFNFRSRYLDGNAISKVEGLENSPRLEELHLSNQTTELSFDPQSINRILVSSEMDQPITYIYIYIDIIDTLPCIHSDLRSCSLSFSSDHCKYWTYPTTELPISNRWLGYLL